MAGHPPPLSNLWGYVAFQEALEHARKTEVVRADADVEVFQHGFLAAWDRMEQAVAEGRGWPPVDEHHLHRVTVTLGWLDASTRRWRTEPEPEPEAEPEAEAEAEAEAS